MPSVAGLRELLTFDNWPMLVLGRIFDRKTGFVAYRKNGCDILIDHGGGDECGTRPCIATDMYRRYLPFFSLRGPARVLDLGANGGGFPLMLKIAGLELAAVVCVEMNPLTYRRLQLNLITNLGFRAVALNAAVCAMPQDSEISLQPSRGSVGESMYTDKTGFSMAPVSVRTVTLQGLYNQHFNTQVIDICKIDIESAEYEVIASTPGQILRQIRYLVLELHDPAKNLELIEKIRALGFAEIMPENRQIVDDHCQICAFHGPQASPQPGPQA